MKRKYKYLNTIEETHTSMIIRAFLAFPLQPEVIWDVGSGGGKVLIESKLRYKNVKLIGIETNPGYEAVMQENMAAHGVASDAIDFVMRDALNDDLSDLPAPDAIYLSFAGSAVEDIIPKLWGLLKPGGSIVCNVSQYGGNDPEKIQRGVSRLRGAHAAFGGQLDEYVYCMWRSLDKKRALMNDVLHWTGKKPV